MTPMPWEAVVATTGALALLGSGIAAMGPRRRLHDLLQLETAITSAAGRGDPLEHVFRLRAYEIVASMNRGANRARSLFTGFLLYAVVAGLMWAILRNEEFVGPVVFLVALVFGVAAYISHMVAADRVEEGIQSIHDTCREVQKDLRADFVTHEGKHKIQRRTAIQK